MIDVRGIDDRGNSCKMSVPDRPVGEYARELLADGWKWVLLLVDGKPAGGVRYDVRHRRRASWCQGQ